jgi:hypothetical protein
MEKFARKCDATGKGMNEGFVVGAGDLHFSEEQHLIKWLKGVAEEENLNFESDKLMLNHYYEEELYYYTEWEEIDDEIYPLDSSDVYYDKDGNEYEF